MLFSAVEWTARNMPDANNSKPSRKINDSDRETVIRVEINLTESMIVAILTLLFGVGFGAQIGMGEAYQPNRPSNSSSCIFKGIPAMSTVFLRSIIRPPSKMILG